MVVVLICPIRPCRSTKVIVVPLTVMVSPAVKPGASESVPVAPDSSGCSRDRRRRYRLVVDGRIPVATLAVLKKLSPAAIAEAATSVVLASVPIARIQRGVEIGGRRAPASLPIAKLPVGGGDRGRRRQLHRRGGAVGQIEGEADLVAGVGIGGAEIDRDRRPAIRSVRSRWRRVSDDDTVLSLRPNGEPAASSATDTDVGVGDGHGRAGRGRRCRDRPALRSAMTCLQSGLGRRCR